MTYDYALWKDGRHWVAHSPSLPGVYGVGGTASVALRDLADGAALLLEYLDEIGERRPRAVALRVGSLEI